MSDETRDDAEQTPDVTRPRPRPRPASTDADETTLPEVDETAEPADTAETAENDDIAAEPAAAGPVSAASRARRIGGRPVVPAALAATSLDLEKTGLTPPPPGVGRHLATPPSGPAKPTKIGKSPDQPDGAAKAPSTTAVWVPAGVLGLAALVLIVFIAIASHGVYWGKSGVSASSRNTAQQAALAAAKTCVATINTYDYRKIAPAETAALACTTGKFTSDLKTVYEKTLKVEAPPAKATQVAQINLAGIRDVSSNGKQIDILIYGQLTLTNASTTASSPQYDPFGAVVTMDNVAGKWLVAKVAADVGDSVGS